MVTSRARYLLLAWAVGLFGLAGAYEFLSLLNTSREIENIQQVTVELLTCRRHEKDFLARRDTIYLKKHDEAYSRLLLAAEGVADSSSGSITPLLGRYRSAFAAVAAGFTEIGLTEDTGLRGTLRRAIHNVEERLLATGDENLRVLMLMCRRYEKDFLLRSDLRSIELFSVSADALLNAAGEGQLGSDQSRDLQAGIGAYRAAFNTLTAIVSEVGLDKDSGLRGEMREAIHDAEDRLATLGEFAQSKREQNVIRTAVLAFLLAVLLSTSLMLLVKITRVNTALSEEVTRRSHAENSLAKANETLEQRVEARTEELVIAREEAILALGQAEEAHRAKSAFLANISHEIRTPLNAIAGFSEILGRTLSTPLQKDHLRGIQDSGRTLLQLISRILDFSRFESEEIELSLASVELPSIFHDLQAHYEPRATAKGIEFRIDLDSELPLIVLLDADRLRQILESLTENAIKFTAGGHVVITARAAHSVTDPHSVDLSFAIQDSGVGIPQDQVEEIFKAFTQKSGQSINEFAGIGMGLALARRIVEAMNGRISVTSQVGSGSTFDVVLPNVRVEGTGTLGDHRERSQPEDSQIDPGGPAAWSPADLSENARSGLLELAGILKERTASVEELASTLTIHEVEDFATEMQQLATQYGFPPLEMWAETLNEQVASFDMQGMAASLQGYAELRTPLQSVKSPTLRPSTVPPVPGSSPK